MSTHFAQTPPASCDALFSTVQVAAFSGASYRQLDYWCRTGALVPTFDARGSGTQRRYTAHETRVAWAVRVAQELTETTTGRGGGLFQAVAGVLVHMPDNGWDGMLILGDGAPLVVDHALALLDAIAELGPAVAIVDLSACPDPLTWKHEP